MAAARRATMTSKMVNVTRIPEPQLEPLKAGAQTLSRNAAVCRGLVHVAFFLGRRFYPLSKP